VEAIGLRSTRIRGLDRTVTTIPNAEFSNMHIVNFTQRDQRLLQTTLQLRYETTMEQMRYILAKLGELFLGHPMVTPYPARVRFIGYRAYSKDIEIFAYLCCQDHDTFLAIQEDILLRVENIIKAAGSGFAFPSRTTYLACEAGLDAERRDEAEAHVESWRVLGKLPSPEFEEEQRERLEDILDYPPKGSPDYTPGVG
jgi:MscS family membrane protein